MLFICRWPNGDFSVVKAASKDEAIELLDEVGNADGASLRKIGDFIANFKLTGSGDFRLEGFADRRSIEELQRKGQGELGLRPTIPWPVARRCS